MLDPRWHLLAVVLAAFALSTPVAAAAQEEAAAESPQDTIYHMVLADGSSFYGYIESETADRVVFRTLGGARLEVERSQIRVLEPETGRVVEGEVWPRDRNATRLFFGPTARSLESGAGYVGLFELFFSFGAVGLGDRVVLAAGTPLFPEAAFRVIYLAPKVRLATVEKLDLAAGVLSFFNLEEPDSGSVGIMYGVGTYGDQDAAVTVGAGWVFALADSAEVANDPVIMLGAEARTSRRVKLITENYVVVANEMFGVLTGGVRLLGERFSADLGVGAAVGLEDGVGCCLPVLSASYTFD